MSRKLLLLIPAGFIGAFALTYFNDAPAQLPKTSPVETNELRQSFGMACSGLGPDARKVAIQTAGDQYRYIYYDHDQKTILRITEAQSMAARSDAVRELENNSARDFCLYGARPPEPRAPGSARQLALRPTL